MADELKTPLARFKSWLSDTANVVTVASLFGGSSFAALIAYLRDSRELTTLALVLAGFSGAFLTVQALPSVWQWLRYRLKPPKTTVQLVGGHSLTLVVQNKGLPVKVRARASFMEFGDEMAVHPAPFDLELFTST